MEACMMPDNLLVKKLCLGDKSAFKQIYTRYWKLLFATTLKRVRVRYIAEEIVQNVFVKLWERRQQSHIRELAHYLQTAARYQAINYIRTNILQRAFTGSMSLNSPTEINDSDTGLLVRELTQAIDQAISDLPEKTRAVFKLSRLERKSNREISESLKISEKTVEYHITQSLKSLRAGLKDFIA